MAAPAAVGSPAGERWTSAVTSWTPSLRSVVFKDGDPVGPTDPLPAEHPTVANAAARTRTSVARTACISGSFPSVQEGRYGGSIRLHGSSRLSRAASSRLDSRNCALISLLSTLPTRDLGDSVQSSICLGAFTLPIRALTN